MLLEFAVQNFKSFKELQVFSLEASTEPKNDDGINRIIEKDGYRVVKTKAIYGANASGKSNLILGLVAMWKILDNNLKSKNVLRTYAHPYRLDSECRDKPCYFQIIFIHKGSRYRYGFEVDKERVHSEWLYVKKKKEVVLFEREGNELIYLNETTFKEGKVIRQGIKMFTEKTLVISVLDQWNSPTSTIVKESINSKIAISVNLPNQEWNHWFMSTMHYFETDMKFQQWTIKLLKEIDGSIQDSAIEEVKMPDGEIEKFPIIIRNSNEGVTPFVLQQEEASGTKKMFDYSSVIYQSLKEGKTLIIDEMDALLHPKLTRKIIELFQSPDAHEEAQLIFATHDTNLMDSDLLRRDQITFVDKSNEGWSEIFDLSDIKGVRAKDLFEKNYMKGNYGALPTLNNLEKVLLTKELVDA